MILIKNGMVKPIVGEDIPNGEVLIDGDKIVKVGKNLDVPADCKVIDATGCLVTPGFIDGHTHIGMMEEGIGEEGKDVNEKTDPISPQMRAIDGFNPMCMGLSEALKGGVTTAITGPGSSDIIGGTFMAVKLYGHRVDDMIIKDPVAMKIAFGQNPKGTYGGQKKAPMTRMAIASMLRDTLNKAIEYNRAVEKANGDPDKMPKYDSKMLALLPVIRKEIPLKAHCHRADDIFTAIRIAKEFDLPMTLDHCTEGHLIAKDLAKEGLPIMVGPGIVGRSKYEIRNLSLETAGALVNAGCEICLLTDANVVPQEQLPVQAGLYVKHGLPLDYAWKAITINPAKMTGIADRVGSLEAGKDADVVIFKGNPITDTCCQTMATIVNHPKRDAFHLAHLCDVFQG